MMNMSEGCVNWGAFRRGAMMMGFEKILYALLVLGRMLGGLVLGFLKHVDAGGSVYVGGWVSGGFCWVREVAKGRRGGGGLLLSLLLGGDGGVFYFYKCSYFFVRGLERD